MRVRIKSAVLLRTAGKRKRECLKRRQRRKKRKDYKEKE